MTSVHPQQKVVWWFLGLDVVLECQLCARTQSGRHKSQEGAGRRSSPCRQSLPVPRSSFFFFLFLMAFNVPRRSADDDRSGVHLQPKEVECQPWKKKNVCVFVCGLFISFLVAS